MPQKRTIESEVASLSENDLKEALKEVEHWRKEGVLIDGRIREISAGDVAKNYPLPVASMQSMVSQEVYRQAALRWAGC